MVRGKIIYVLCVLLSLIILTKQECMLTDGKKIGSGKTWNRRDYVDGLRQTYSREVCHCKKNKITGLDEPDCHWWTKCMTNEQKLRDHGETWEEIHTYDSPLVYSRKICTCEYNNATDMLRSNCNWDLCTTDKGKKVTKGHKWKYVVKDKVKKTYAVKICTCSRNIRTGRLIHRCGWSANCYSSTGRTWIKVGAHLSSISSDKKNCVCRHPVYDKDRPPYLFCSHRIGCFTREGKSVSVGEKWVEKNSNTNTQKECTCVNGKLLGSRPVRNCKWRQFCFVGKKQYSIGEKFQDGKSGQKCKCLRPTDNNDGPPTVTCVYNLGCPNNIIPDKFEPLGTVIGPCVCKRGKTRDTKYFRSYYWDCSNKPLTCALDSGDRMTVGMEYYIGTGQLEKRCTCTKIPGKQYPYVVCVYLRGCYSYYHDMSESQHKGYFPYGWKLKNGCFCTFAQKDSQKYKGVHYHWNCNNRKI